MCTTSGWYFRYWFFDRWRCRRRKKDFTENTPGKCLFTFEKYWFNYIWVATGTCKCGQKPYVDSKNYFHLCENNVYVEKFICSVNSIQTAGVFTELNKANKTSLHINNKRCLTSKSKFQLRNLQHLIKLCSTQETGNSVS